MPSGQPQDPAAADVGNRGRGAVVVGGMRRPRNVRARIAAVQRARAPATIPEEEEEEGGRQLTTMWHLGIQNFQIFSRKYFYNVLVCPKLYLFCQFGSHRMWCGMVWSWDLSRTWYGLGI